jgi:hypothetical protein
MQSIVATCTVMRTNLLRQMFAELIDKLGGPKQVAELTGRSTRVERQRGNLVFALRAASESSEMDSLNIMVRISACRCFRDISERACICPYMSTLCFL